MLFIFVHDFRIHIFNKRHDCISLQSKLMNVIIFYEIFQSCKIINFIIKKITYLNIEWPVDIYI